MNHYPMILKTQCEGSLVLGFEYINNSEDLRNYMRYRIRNYQPYTVANKRLNWWLIRCEDDVVIAQSKGFKP